MRLHFGARLLPTTALALLTGIILSACEPEPPAPPQPAAACPDSAPRDSVQLDACLQGIVFDTAYGVTDSQPLTVIDSLPPESKPAAVPCPDDPSRKLRCRYGPLAKIEPVIGAQRYSDADLQYGRIIARLWIPGTEKEGYQKYGMQPGDSTYWWVKMDKSGEGGTSVFITRSSKDRTLREPVTRDLHRERDKDDRANPEYKGRKWWRATARWLWDLLDETAKGKCGSGSCS